MFRQGLVGRSALALAAIAIALAVALAVAPRASADTTECPSPSVDSGAATVVCSFTGADQTWTVPDFVTRVTFTAIGAEGGLGWPQCGCTQGTPGKGGNAIATFGVSPGTTYTVTVGGQGGGGKFGAGVNGGEGGFGGGGHGGSCGCVFLVGAGGGGGASTVADPSGSPLVIGGGGGGASAVGCSTGGFGGPFYGTGGDGGGLDGKPGINGTQDTPNVCDGPGGGGTQTAGGAGGAPASVATACSSGYAGEGGSRGQGGKGQSSVAIGAGAGGGGGYYGGGGGAACGSGGGGGGGSGYVAPSGVDASLNAGVRSGDGLVVINYQVPVDTSVSVSSSDSAPGLGDPVTLTATVAPAPSGGTVAFDDGGQPISGCEAQPVDTGGMATCTTSSLALGPHTITVDYSGTGGFVNSSGGPITVTVGTGSVRVSVTGTQTYGSTPSFTTKLPSPPAGVTVSGSASCTGVTSPARAIAASLPAGTYALDPATCSGVTIGGPNADDYRVTYEGSLEVAPAPLTVTVPTATATYGNVPASFAPTYTGLVNGETAPATPAACTSNATDTSPPGDYDITCSGASDDNYTIAYSPAGGVRVGALTIGKAPSAVALTAIPASGQATRGTPITFTATVTADHVTGPTGTVSFSVGGTTLCGSVPVVTAAGATQASCTTTQLPAGTSQVDAGYSGDANVAGASGHLGYEVARETAAIALDASPDDAVTGQSVTLTVEVTGTAARPTGTVAFTRGAEAIDPACAAVTLAPGGDPLTATARCTTTRLTAPGGPVTAAYGGDAAYAPAQAATTVSVSKALTSTTVAVAADRVSAMVRVEPPGGGTPTGSVAFSVDGRPAGTAAVVSGTATLPVRLSTTQAHAVAAVYSGDAGYAASAGSTARRNPAIVARVTSAHPRSKRGWYRSPVTVTFACTPAGAPLTGPCPGPVTLSRNTAGTTVSRTIVASDGGAATATVSRVKIDRTPPAVRVRLSGTAARCVARDALSGVASCTLRTGRPGAYVATAVDRAGNKTVRRASLPRFVVVGAPRRGGAYATRLGRYYTVEAIVPTAQRPHYVDAAPAGRMPTGGNYPMSPAGKHTWVIRIYIKPQMRHHRQWVLGVRVGGVLYRIPVTVGRARVTLRR